MASTGSRRRQVSLKRRLLFSAIVVCTLSLLLEGFCSVLYVAKEMFFNQPIAERISTEYDPELGWVAKKNFFDANHVRSEPTAANQRTAIS